MWRSLEIFGYTVFLAKILIWIVLPELLESQSLPVRNTDYFGIDQRSIFYDNNRIPDGLEVSPYLFVNVTKKYFFLVEQSVPKAEITIHPCASPIRWQVTYKEEQRLINYNIKPRLDPSVGINSIVNTKDVLYTFHGELAETLRLDSPQLGIYVVEITSLRSDSYVKIFATTSPDIERFPELPTDTNIKSIETDSNTLLVSWNSSPDERHYGDDIEYCIAINRKRNYRTLCSLRAHLEGDVKPTLPPHSGFGFKSEAYKKRYIRQKANPIKAEKKGSILFKCIGRNTSSIIRKLKQGRRYYVDVFVRNRSTQKASQYTGVTVQTRRSKKLTILKDGKHKTVVFRKRKSVRAYLFKLNSVAKDVHIVVYSCKGYIDVEFKNRNNTFHKSKVKGLKKLTLKNIQPGNYILKLSRPVRRRQNVYILVSTKSKKVRVPVLPDDTTVKVFDYLTSCNSITVAWMGTTTKQEYCLYKTEINNSSLSTPYKKLTQCGATKRRRSAQKIICKKFKHRKKDHAVLAITVTGLHPGTSYIFDVFVKKGKEVSLPYNSVRTETSPHCVLPT